jgi:hypothetical protein
MQDLLGHRMIEVEKLNLIKIKWMCVFDQLNVSVVQECICLNLDKGIERRLP